MRRIPYILLLILLSSCQVKSPSDYADAARKPGITPDYTDLVIPSNIAPLNFSIMEDGDRFMTAFSTDREKIILKGHQVQMNPRKWHRLLDGSGKITVQVFTRNGKKWTGYTPFCLEIAENIDPYLSYRLIPPSFEQYEMLTISQRNLETFKERVIYSNAMLQTNENGQCINCHNFRNWQTDNMQFHVRQYLGGTVLVTDGQVRKINLKTDSTLSAGVYPAWHPTHNFIAYSVNQTKQSIHTTHHNRIEVQDLYSDLILYDIDRNQVSIIENDPNVFECFPNWTPDGRTLYYVAAAYRDSTDERRMGRLMASYQEVRYDLYKKEFDPETASWGMATKVIDAASMNKSITLPRVSPDGRYLIFTMGDHGVFHIWHSDADLYMMDLTDGSYRCLSEINSNDVDSYHSWSSNGKWIVFSTRRDDGTYTRPYFAHFNADGTFSKPFALPQKNPGFSASFMLSYNIPEFTIEPVRTSPREFARVIEEQPAAPVDFRSSKKEAL